MAVERWAVAGRESRQARGVGVELMLVQDRKVVGFDVPESNFVAHFCVPGSRHLAPPNVPAVHRREPHAE